MSAPADGLAALATERIHEAGVSAFQREQFDYLDRLMTQVDALGGDKTNADVDSTRTQLERDRDDVMSSSMQEWPRLRDRVALDLDRARAALARRTATAKARSAESARSGARPAR